MLLWELELLETRGWLIIYWLISYLGIEVINFSYLIEPHAFLVILDPRRLSDTELINDAV